jgi:hypothetical protein
MAEQFPQAGLKGDRQAVEPLIHTMGTFAVYRLPFNLGGIAGHPFLRLFQQYFLGVSTSDYRVREYTWHPQTRRDPVLFRVFAGTRVCLAGHNHSRNRVFMNLPQIPGRIGRVAFIAAGSLMLCQVLVVGLRRHDFAVSELWAALPGVAAIIASIVGLIALYPRFTGRSRRLALAGVGAALGAGVILCAAATWLAGSAVLGGGVPQPLPGGLLAAIAGFMIAYVLGFVLNAAAGLRSEGMRHVGWLLLVPVASWSVILGVAVTSNMGDALKLDLYTNAVIALAFIAIGVLLKNGRTP